MQKQIKRILCILLILSCLAPYNHTNSLLVAHLSIIFSKDNSALLVFYKSFGVKDSLELFNKLIDKVPEKMPHLSEIFRELKQSRDREG